MSWLQIVATRNNKDRAKFASRVILSNSVLESIPFAVSISRKVAFSMQIATGTTSLKTTFFFVIPIEKDIIY